MNNYENPIIKPTVCTKPYGCDKCAHAIFNCEGTTEYKKMLKTTIANVMTKLKNRKTYTYQNGAKP